MRRFAFPDRSRLSSRHEFDRVFKNCSSRSSDALFTVLARPSEHNHPRLGLVISARATGNAVCRHRLKRQIRESFRLDQHDLPAADIVVIARPGVRKSQCEQISRSLAAHWKRISGQCAQ